jgi:hypothetical protein
LIDALFAPLRILKAYAGTDLKASKFVQIKPDLEALLRRHAAIALDLHPHSVNRRHRCDPLKSA